MVLQFLFIFRFLLPYRSSAARLAQPHTTAMISLNQGVHPQHNFLNYCSRLISTPSMTSFSSNTAMVNPRSQTCKVPRRLTSRTFRHRCPIPERRHKIKVGDPVFEFEGSAAGREDGLKSASSKERVRGCVQNVLRPSHGNTLELEVQRKPLERTSVVGELKKWAATYAMTRKVLSGNHSTEEGAIYASTLQTGPCVVCLFGINQHLFIFALCHPNK